MYIQDTNLWQLYSPLECISAINIGTARKRCFNATKLGRKLFLDLTGLFVSGWLAVNGGTSKERGLNSVHINFTYSSTYTLRSVSTCTLTLIA